MNIIEGVINLEHEVVYARSNTKYKEVQAVIWQIFVD
jgi:hypothetical protein